MVRSLLKDGRGYSLIEVMVSIIILALAILPMIGMFDMGLNGVTASSHYDKARTLANLKLEQAKNLPFTDVEGNFPDAGDYDPLRRLGTGSRSRVPTLRTSSTPFIRTTWRNRSPRTRLLRGTSSRPSGASTGLIRLTVEVRWGEDNDGDGLPDKSFTTTGLVAQ